MSILKMKLYEFKYQYITRPLNKLWWKFIYALPKKLVFYAAIRVGAHATTGQYGNTVVPDMTFMEAIERWDK